MFSQNELFCGPHCETVWEGTQLRSLKIGEGEHTIDSILSILAKLPEPLTPDLIVIHSSSFELLKITGLAACEISTIYIESSVRINDMPRKDQIEYVVQSDFNRLILTSSRGVQWYCSLGFPVERIAIDPLILLNVHKNEVKQLRSGVLFYGTTTSKTHPYRFSILSHLQADSTSLTVKAGSCEEAAEHYASHLINLNISRNGDINRRVFEIIAAGGFLLTDRLSAQSDLAHYFTEGVEYDCFGSYAELIEKIGFYESSPEKAIEIAQAGYERFWNDHSAEKRTATIRETCSDEFQSSLVVEHYSPQLFPIYNFIEGLHLEQENITIGLAHSTPDHFLQLFTAFSRVEIIRDFRSDIIVDILFLDHLEMVQDSSIPMYETLVVLSEADPQLVSTLNLTALDISPFMFRNEAGLCAQGERFMEQENRLKAFECFKQILTTGRLSARLYWNLARLSQHSGAIDDAMGLLDEAFIADPNCKEALLLHSKILLEQGKTREAIPSLQHLIALEPENVHYLVALGRLLAGDNRFNEALLLFQRAIALDSSLVTEEELRSAKMLSGRTYIRPRIKNKKILVVTNIFPPQELGGYGRTMLDFSTLLRSRGHTVEVLTSDTPYLGDLPAVEPHIFRDLELFGQWVNGKADTFEMDRAIPLSKRDAEIVSAHCDRFQPDFVLLGNVDFIGYHTIQMLNQRGIPMIHRLGNREPGYGPEVMPHKDLYRLATCSGWLRDEIWRDGQKLPKIDVVYPAGKVRHYYRESLPSLTDRPFHISFAGIVQPYKGPHILLEALFKLHRMGVPFTASIAGTTTDEQFYSQLQNEVSKRGLSEAIEFVGFLDREKLKDLFWESSVYVQPSVFPEPFGISHVEAMASGATVITSGTGGSREIIIDGESGLHFRSEDSTHLAEQLKYLYENPEESDRLRRAGQERAMTLFDNEKSVDRLEEIFAEMVYGIQ